MNYPLDLDDYTMNKIGESFVNEYLDKYSEILPNHVNMFHIEKDLNKSYGPGSEYYKKYIERKTTTCFHGIYFDIPEMDSKLVMKKSLNIFFRALKYNFLSKRR